MLKYLVLLAIQGYFVRIVFFAITATKSDKREIKVVPIDNYFFLFHVSLSCFSLRTKRKQNRVATSDFGMHFPHCVAFLKK